MKALHVRYQLQAGPYCFVPDPWNDGMFHAPGGMKLSEMQIRQLATRQKWEIEKVRQVAEINDDLENT
jgi:hypothetical protein